MVDIPNDILLTQHHDTLNWVGDLLRKKYFLVRNNRVFEVEFPYLSFLHDMVVTYIGYELNEFFTNVLSVNLKPTDLSCEDVEEEILEEDVKFAHRLYPLRKIPFVKHQNSYL